jgi:hypothetical protein
MPNIQPLEAVIVGAGFLMFCAVPALVSWADARARRRLQRAAVVAPADAGEAAGGATDALQASPDAGPLPVPEPAPNAVASAAAEEVSVPREGSVDFLADTPPSTELRTNPETCGPSTIEGPPEAGGSSGHTGGSSGSSEMSVRASTVPEAREGEPETVLPEVAGAAALAPPPPAGGVEGAPAFEFRLQDLRRARLLDWPPATIRENAERQRIWQEGVRLAAAHQGRIDTVPLRAPYLPQSACFGTAETAAGVWRLRYFLFKDLWPVVENQVVSEAVFEINEVGEVQGRLEAHRPVS